MAPPKKCSGCGAVVSRSALDSGRAYMDEGVLYCEDCALLIREPESPSEEGETFPEPDEATPTDATVELSMEPLKRRLAQTRREKPARRMSSRPSLGVNLTAIVISALVAAAIIAAVLLFRR